MSDQCSKYPRNGPHGERDARIGSHALASTRRVVQMRLWSPSKPAPTDQLGGEPSRRSATTAPPTPWPESCGRCRFRRWHSRVATVDTAGMRIGMLLYNGVDLIDAGGPYEVFLTASRLAMRDGSDPPFEVVTLTPDGAPVTTYGGLGLVPHASATDPALALDALLVPGTIDIDAALADDVLAAAVKALTTATELTASVCTGAFLLAAAGILEGRPWTTHWEDVDDLAMRLGTSDSARRGVRWVDDGDVVTAAGLTSGIAMALHLVDRCSGRDLAARTARQLDYPWSPEPDRRDGRPT
jgi:transcriptional regulator GlxA family with amidase domain